MIRALVWKEYREHRAIWLTLAVVGGAGLLGVQKLMSPGGVMASTGTRESLQAVAALLAWTYGLVCGSMLLANERETATLDFLDMLPVRRLQLWTVKCSFGLVLFLAQVAVLTVVVVGLDIASTPLQVAGTVLAMLLFGLLGMAWGLLFSARGENVLNVIGLAIVGQIAGIAVVAMALSLLAIGMELVLHFASHGPSSSFPWIAVNCLGGIVVTVGPIVGSARLFSRVDRQRGLRVKAPVRQRRPKRIAWASWGRLIWLSYLQMRRMILILVIFSMGLGFLLPAAGPVAWPILTLIIGVLCGVTVFGDEQLHGSFRFLGDQRLPLGRVWLVKASMRFALAVFAAFLLLLPSLILVIFHRMQAPSFEQQRVPFFGEVLHSVLVGTVVPAWAHLGMWLIYGFTAAHLCGLLFRKSMVAGVVSLGAAATLVSVWVPSLLGIGLHFWQIAGVPLILLTTAWLLMPAWAADRLVARGTFERLGVGLAGVVLWTVGGLWYRVAEIPDLPDGFDLAEFRASIPPPEKNDAGMTIREAWTSVKVLTRALSGTRARRPLFPDLHPEDTSLGTQIVDVRQRGWPEGPSDLSDWLDQHFEQKGMTECLCLLCQAADYPVGVVEYNKDMTFDQRLDDWSNAAVFNQLLAVRALQLQSRGDHKSFVEYLRMGLAVSRNLQHFAPIEIAHFGRKAEDVWPPALDHWLGRLEGPADEVGAQLKRVQAVLRQHEEELPDESEIRKMARLIASNSLDQIPEQMLEFGIEHRAKEDSSLRRAELEAASLMWRIPWERERHHRILRVSFEGDNRQLRQAREWGGPMLGGFGPREIPRGNRYFAQWRASQLKVALRRYQAKMDKLPATLDALVPAYLPAIPIDPFDQKPFRYRLSQGEKIGWFEEAEAAGAVPGGMPNAGGAAPPAQAGMPGLFNAPPPPPTRFVPAGEGILWSVGEDLHDDGGAQQGKLPSLTTFGEDIIYLVPPPRG